MKILSKLTIGKYQRLHLIDQELDPVEQMIQSVMIIEGKGRKEVLDIKMSELKKQFAEWAQVDRYLKNFEKSVPKTLKLGSQVYQVFPHPKDWSSGQLIDVLNMREHNTEPIAIMDRLIAAICVRKKRSYDSEGLDQRAEGVRDVLLMEVWGLFVFFFNLWIRFFTVTEDYLLQQMEMTKEEIQEFLRTNGDGG